MIYRASVVAIRSGAGSLFRQVFLLIVMTVIAWYAMMAVHELGHCLGAWTSGGDVERVSIPLLGFSQTYYGHNPSPLWTTWAGPVFGALVGVLFGGVEFVTGGFIRYVLLYVAGFFLLANGIYLGAGGFVQVGDCGELLSDGAKLWQLVVFGAASVAMGFYFWHRMGPFTTWFEAGGQGLQSRPGR